LNVSALKSEVKACTITADDGVKISANTFSITVDNSGPVISFNGPSSSSYSSGSVQAYGGAEGAERTYFAISTSDSISPDSNDEITTWTAENGTSTTIANISSQISYSEIEDAGLTWFVYFDGNLTATSGTHLPTLNTYLTNFGITTLASLTDTNNPFSTIVKLYLWIKSVDDVGNVSEDKHLILLDPQGDKPNVSVSYPNVFGQTLGGTIRINGSAEDTKGPNPGVNKVWVQIISTTHTLQTYTGGTTFGSTTVDTENHSVTAFTPSQNDLDYLKAAGYTLYNMKTYATEETHIPYNGTIVTGYASDYAIPATLSGSSWSLQINEKKEFNPSTSATNPMVMRVYAMDNDGKFSTNVDDYFIFDSSNPIIGNSQSLYLVQSTSNSLTISDNTPNFSATASREYVDDMFVKGEWWLIGSVEDNDAIKTLKIGGNSLVKDGEIQVSTDWKVIGSGTAESKTFSKEDDSTQNVTANVYKTLYFKYKLSTSSGVGSQSLTMNVIDAAQGTAGNTTKNLTVKYDNKAPVLVGPESESYNISPSVQQSNGYYSFGSQASEDAVGNYAQSGFDNVAFYFMRRDITGTTEADKVYNPMVKNGNPTSISDLTYEDGLWWKSVTVGRSAGSLNVLTDVTADSNIRVNGLVKIGGSFYKITSISGTTVTLNGNPDVSYTSALFACAMVIDNTVPESGSSTRKTTDDGYGYPDSITGDDNDEMVEYVEKTNGTLYNWSASIVSRNIPDGPIELHYVVFDKAGNYSIGIAGNMTESIFAASSDTTYAQTADRTHYQTLKAAEARASNVLYVDATKSLYNGSETLAASYHVAAFAKAAYVSNNAPRMAGFTIATDYDGDGAFTSTGETITSYNAATISSGSITGTSGSLNVYNPDEYVTGTARKNPLQTSLTAGTTSAPVMKIRDVTKITPEIVGGNGKIYYKYEATNGANSLTGSNYTTELITAGSTDYTIQSGDINLQLGDILKLGDSATGIPFKLTFYDSTDGTVTVNSAGTSPTSQKAELTIHLAVNAQTVGTPSVEINPFYWTSASSNSLYGNSTSNGHIELEADLPTTTFTGVSGIYDRDPKVSGQIVIEGSAHDDNKIEAIYVSIPGMTMGTNTKTVSGTTFYRLADYNDTNHSMSGTDAYTASGYKFEIVSETQNANGHDVTWKLSWNTAKISTVANADVAVQVIAYNKGAPACASANTGTLSIDGRSHYADAVYNSPANNTPVTTNTASGAKTAYYKVDVVPYITGIKTELSDGNRRRPTVLSRSALGHYPVRRGSNITVEGFNFNGTSSKVLIGTKEYAPTDASTTNSLVITTDANTTSDVVTAKVGTVESLNNKTAKKIVTGSGENATSRVIEYNSEPNDQNNDLLTDERKLHVVDVYTTTNTTDKRMLDMAVIGNDLYFSAGYGPDYFATMRANGTTIDNVINLRQSYTRYFDNAMAVTSDGTIYTVSACGDSYNAVTGWANGPSHLALTKGDPGNYVWEYYGTYTNNNTSMLFLESNWNGATLNNLDRYKLPDLVLKGSSTNATGYLSYYDTTLKAIKFRYFTSTDRVANNLTAGIAGTTLNGAQVARSVEGTIRNDNPNGKTYNQGYYVIAGAAENSSYSSVGVSGSTALVSWYDASSSALKMKYNTNIANSFSGYQTFTTLPTAGTVTFKLSVDGGAAEDVSVTYENHDTGDAQHEFAYQLNLKLSEGGYGAFAEVTPVQNNTNKNVTVRSMQTGTNSSIEITNLSSGAVGTAVAGNGVAWNEVTVDSESAGQYVSMKTDSKGGIHFAYYDTGNGDLKYAYMSSVTATPKVVTVDGYQQVGQYVDLALKETASGTSTSVTPYIGYYSMSNADTRRAAKVAKLAEPIEYTGNTSDSTSLLAGSTDELFTGKWEVMHIPTAGIPVQYRVNIGVTSGGNVYISYLADRTIEYVKVE
ncbi:MAG: hypothetical protein K5829_01000, partial [Treponema sp.]|nr:hypothetical protein [Treponema sp.]